MEQHNLYVPKVWSSNRAAQTHHAIFLPTSNQIRQEEFIGGTQMKPKLHGDRWRGSSKKPGHPRKRHPSCLRGGRLSMPAETRDVASRPRNKAKRHNVHCAPLISFESSCTCLCSRARISSPLGKIPGGIRIPCSRGDKSVPGRWQQGWARRRINRGAVRCGREEGVDTEEKKKSHAFVLVRPPIFHQEDARKRRLRPLPGSLEPYIRDGQSAASRRYGCSFKTRTALPNAIALGLRFSSFRRELSNVLCAALVVLSLFWNAKFAFGRGWFSAALGRRNPLWWRRCWKLGIQWNVRWQGF